MKEKKQNNLEKRKTRRIWRMSNMLLPVKNKRGYTLVELIVVMAITLLIMTAAVSFFQPTQMLASSMRTNADMDVLCDTANRYIRNSTICAKNIAVVSWESDTTDVEAKQDSMAASLSTLPAGYNLWAIGIIGGKLYDFGMINGTVSGVPVNIDISGLISSPNNYRIFNDDFYGLYNFTMKVEGDPSLGAWMNVSSQCFDDGGDFVNQSRKTGYKFVDREVALSYDVDYDNESNIMIYYTAYSTTSP